MDAIDLPDPGEPALPLLKPGCLKESVFALSKDYLFTDRVLPAPAVSIVKHSEYPVSYYLDLHRETSAPGRRGQYTWPAGTPNYLSARVPLRHISLNLEKWRKHLIGYRSPEVAQMLEFGFPLGLQEQAALSPALRVCLPVLHLAGQILF